MTMIQPRLSNATFEAYKSGALSEEAFARALIVYVTKLVKRASKHGKARHATYCTIEDAIGESLLEVWEHLDTFDPTKSSLSTYVATVVLRNVIDVYRRYNKRQEVAFVEEMHEAPFLGGTASKLSLKALLSTLSRDDREFLKMKFDGLSEAEIDAAFKREPGWANDKLRNLKRKLRFLALPCE
jgi:RNA polymerase sigma factor (sigma-70 family)